MGEKREEMEKREEKKKQMREINNLTKKQTGEKREREKPLDSSLPEPGSNGDVGR